MLTEKLAGNFYANPVIMPPEKVSVLSTPLHLTVHEPSIPAVPLSLKPPEALTVPADTDRLPDASSVIFDTFEMISSILVATS